METNRGRHYKDQKSGIWAQMRTHITIVVTTTIIITVSKHRWVRFLGWTLSQVPRVPSHLSPR